MYNHWQYFTFCYDVSIWNLWISLNFTFLTSFVFYWIFTVFLNYWLIQCCRINRIYILYVVSKYKISLLSAQNRLKMIGKPCISPHPFFLNLIQINFIFQDNVRIFYVDKLTSVDIDDSLVSHACTVKTFFSWHNVEYYGIQNSKQTCIIFHNMQKDIFKLSFHNVEYYGIQNSKQTCIITNLT